MHIAVVQALLAISLGAGPALAAEPPWRKAASAIVAEFEQAPSASYSDAVGPGYERMHRSFDALARADAPTRAEVVELLTSSDSRERMIGWVVVSEKRMADAALLRQAWRSGPADPPDLERLLRADAVGRLDPELAKEVASDLVAIFASERGGFVILAMPGLEKLPMAEFTEILRGIARQPEPHALEFAYLFAARRSPAHVEALREALRKAGALETLEAIDGLQRSRPANAGPVRR
ncbi:MAG TPA: hypothetical protein VFP50_16825 [Anaeromyxobacteraceae bacterium]|nr:hypothetical protein [Anaeromyxobacteraceae bacterium]